MSHYLQLFTGEDTYRRRRALARALAEQLRAGANRVDLSGRAVTAERLATVLGAPSLFAPSQVVVLEEVDRLGGAERRALVEGIASLRQGGVEGVVVLADARGGRKPHAELCRAADRQQTFDPFRREREAVRWLTDHVRRQEEASMGRGAARALVERIGPGDSGRLAQEAAKLATLADGGTIEVDDVAFAAGSTPGVSPYALQDAIGERRYGEAVRLLRGLLTEPDQSGVRIAIGITAHLARVGRARALLDEGRSPSSVAAAFDRQWLGKKYVAQARGWTAEELDRALVTLTRADQALKSGADERHTLETFLARVLVDGRPAAPLDGPRP